MTDQDKLPVAVGETLAKAAVAILVPYGAAPLIVYDTIRKRLAAKGELTITEITESISVERLAERLQESPVFEALTVNALDTAMRTGYEPKRRVLGRVIINAALDEARVDESMLIEQALRELDRPHVRALERIRLAVDGAPREGTPSDQNTARSGAANQAVTGEPEPLRAVLLRTGVALGPYGLLLGQQGAHIGGISDFGRKLLDELRAAVRDDAPL